MDNLVEISNEQVVTSSRNIARDFNKRHTHVLEAIDETMKSAEKSADLFYKTTYVHEQNKQEYREYLINRDGFTLLAMGFTGKKAMNFKLKYIEAFNEMEKELKKPNTTKTLLQASLEHEERLEGVENDVNYLKDSMRISSSQQLEIQSKAKSKVVKALGGKEAPAYKTYNRKAFSRFWNEFKNYFYVARYGDIPKVKFDDAVEWINEWQPDTSTKMTIRDINEQMTTDE